MERSPSYIVYKILCKTAMFTTRRQLPKCFTLHTRAKKNAHRKIYKKAQSRHCAQNRAESEACFLWKKPGNGAPKALSSLVVFSNTQDLRRCGWKRDVHFSLSKNYHSLPFHGLKRRWAPSGNVLCIKVHQRYSGGKISGNLFFDFL